MSDYEYLKKYLDTSKLEDGLKRLKAGEPVQYIIGNVEFFDLKLDVNPSVLIPRFETEELVDRLIKYIILFFKEKKISILDIGTGSGCIALTLKSKLPESVVDACDISAEALKVAEINAKKNRLEVNFIHSNIFKNIQKKYDVIVSNPPYIAYDEQIMEIVYKNEPHEALYAANNGLYFYEEILKKASEYLNKKSILAFEIGDKQGDSIKNIALEYFPNSKILIEKDLQQRDRFVFIFNND